MHSPVLALWRNQIPSGWLLPRGGLILSAQQFQNQVPVEAIQWPCRAAVERDHRYKQLIPYILVRYRGRLACYCRQGNERRLHGCWSVGVGGHVDEADRSEDLCTTLYAAARRELQEELPGIDSSLQLHWLGLINEEETSVGHTHLGLVLVAEAEGPEPPIGGSELGDLCWLPPENIRRMPLEIWSELALALL